MASVRAWLLGAAGASALLAGCAQTQVDPRLRADVDAGQYALARTSIQQKLTDNPGDRSYILDRLRLLILSLADGHPAAAEQVANQTFRLLRTQGLNADRTTASVVFNEGVKIWKGEPYEQAMAYAYIAMQKAQMGEWDNARASANSSLFLLKSFGENERGEEMTSLELARRAAEEDARNGEGAGDRYINKGYTPIKTNFALGYLLNGVANRAMGREDEAADNFHEAAAVRRVLGPLASALHTGEYNTVFVVDYGVGPTKIATGPDDTLAGYQENWPSDDRPLRVAVDGGSAPLSEAPPVQDINAMARSLMWNNLEDVRVAKSVLGSAMMVGGLAVAAGSKDDEARYAGLGVALAGLVMKTTAKADTRHAEFLPQRVYVVPVRIDAPDSTVTLEVDGDSSSRIVLTAIDPPAHGGLQLRYVKLPARGGQEWATSGRVFYGNDEYAGRVDGDTLPYILGGRDVSLPTPRALERYQQAGWLTDFTTVDLENLYREEGIALSVEDARGGSRRHVLEGGDSLVPPLAGTTGYARLFGRTHPPYEPRSQRLRELTKSLRRDDRAQGEQ
jgi:hypothetical protein